jgi:murein DD-endopeptidase MepM/ murein hydrolase activator NlpD
VRTRAPTCPVCGDEVGEGERFVLARGRHREAYCSETCLVANVERRRRAAAEVRRRWLLRALVLTTLAVGGPQLWHRFHLPQRQSISFEPPEVRPLPAPRPEPVYYGPAWPPTDEDWLRAFAETAWIYPLPGPARRAGRVDDRILAGRPSTRRAPPVCHEEGRCGVDLGGELWGEHVYAVHDGVVDHIQRALGDDRGDVYLRLSHFGGMVFTHYFHLAAVPRGIARGVAIKAGEVIGLVGDTGNEHPGRYIHFALSVRPSPELPEVYWDPSPLMSRWPLRLPPHGTVAGYVPSEADLAVPPLRRRRTTAQ